MNTFYNQLGPTKVQDHCYKGRQFCAQLYMYSDL